MDFWSQLTPVSEESLRVTSRMTASMSTWASMMSTFLMTSWRAAMSPLVPIRRMVLVRVSARILVLLESCPIRVAAASPAVARMRLAAAARASATSERARERSLEGSPGVAPWEEGVVLSSS